MAHNSKCTIHFNIQTYIYECKLFKEKSMELNTRLLIIETF